jgi:hypothetical protein
MTGASPEDGFGGGFGKKVLSRKTLTFRGIFEKTGDTTWCFDGQFVVRCMVNVVFWMVCFKG